MKRKNHTKKIIVTTIHVIAVICLVLTVYGMTFAIDSVGGSVFTFFQKTEAEETESASLAETEEQTESSAETEKETEPTSETANTNISYQDEEFREEFYSQLKEAIEYTWYVHAFEDGDGNLALTKKVVNAADEEDTAVSYSIQDLIHYTERYGTYDTGQKPVQNDNFADFYWNEMLKVNWCAFDLTFDLEFNPGAPVAYENRLVGITNVFNQQMERYSQLKEKFTGRENGLFFQIAYYIGDNPYPVVVTNHEEELDYTKLDTYFMLKMPESEVDTNLPGFDSSLSYYDLPEITDTAHKYKISNQPSYSITAGWADSSAALTEAVNAAAQQAAEESRAAAETETQTQTAAETEAQTQEALPVQGIPDLTPQLKQEELSFYRDIFQGCTAAFFLSLLLAALTLVWMLFNTGKVINQEGKSRTVLTGIDLWYVEAMLAMVIGLLIFWNYLPVTHSQGSSFPLSEAMGWLGSYFIVLAGGLSLVRRARAGKLAEQSVLPVIGRKMQQLSQDFSAHQKPVTKTILSFIVFAAANFFFIWMLITGWQGLQGSGRKKELFQVAAAVIMLLALYGAALYSNLAKAVQRQKILDGVDSISGGKLDSKIDLERLTGEEYRLADSINHIGDGLLSAVGSATKSERMKTELITNVSHDIKTPLTSIINYVDLLKREDIQNERARGYISVLEQKSQRLKNLIEDLVEASKVSSGNVALELERIDFCQLVKQIDGEFEERFEAAGLHMVTTIPDMQIFINADGRRVWRILENLYQNALKYAMKDSRVYISVVPFNNTISFVMKNISASPLNFDAQELTERFIRGDVSRATEGSGLGLSIAKSLTELHNGEFQVYLDGDLFKVSVTFAVVK